MLISPFFIAYSTPTNKLTTVSIWEMMGFRVGGFFMALVIPFLLTAVLFFGPICSQVMNGVWKIYMEPMYWINNFQDILWLRNHVVAPLSEEFTFRACMMPLLLQSFKSSTAVLLTPLFFGVAHLHHMIERLQSGMEVKVAIILSCNSLNIVVCIYRLRINIRFHFIIFSISIYLYGYVWSLFCLFIC